MAEDSSRNQRIQHLQSAFHSFNSLSEQLMASYHQLQAQVRELSVRLSAAEFDGHQQCLETERLVRRHQRLLEALPGGVVVLDGQGVVSECNPAAVALLGEPLQGQHWLAVIRRAFAPRRDDGHEVSLRDGRRLSIATSALNCEPGQILLLKDITETRRLQDTLARYQRLSGMGQVAAALAHQVRTPVSSALLYVSQLTASAADPQRVVHCAEKIRAQLQHVEHMVREMLGMVRGEGDALAFESLTVSLLLERLAQVVRPQVEGCGGVLVMGDESAGAQIRGSATSLLGALSNLVTNALQVGDTAPRIGVAARQQDDSVMISVEDNGPGIPRHLRESLFQPFVTGRPQGTGLGLAVVRNVVSQHGGTIDFSSTPGRGTVFVIHLPLLNSKAADGGRSIITELDGESHGRADCLASCNTKR